MTTITWTSTTSGNWNTASNWSGDQVPGAGDDALINVPGGYQITVAGVTLNSLTLDDAAGEVLATGGLDVTSGMVITAGTLFVDTGGAVTAAGNLSNSGTIIDNGFLSAHVADGQALERIGGNGILLADVALSNFGTIDLASAETLLQFRIEGALQGGTIFHLNSQTGEVGRASVLTLQNVALGGTMDVMGGNSQNPGGTLVFNGGVSLTGSDGTGAATLLLAGALNPAGTPAVMEMNGTQTLDNALVITRGGQIDVPDMVTLGPDLTLRAETILHSVSGEITGAGQLLNKGTINAEAQIDINVTAFANSGLVEVTPTSPPGVNGILISSSEFDNLAAGRLETTAGVIQVSGNAANAGRITAFGTDGIIEFLSGTVSNLSGAFILTSGGMVSFAEPVMSNMSGATIRTSSGTITFDGATNLTNDGTISTTGGLVDIAAVLGGSGIVTLDGNGVVDVHNATSKSEIFDFTGAGALVLNQPAFVASKIDGFSSKDTIQLGVSATPISYTDGDLKMQVSGGTIDLGITGPHALADFIVTTDSTSTQINLACFAAGTRIQTTNGPIEVEHLRVGDSVIVTEGKPLPIVWIGHRAVHCARHVNHAAVWPVRIASGAFAVNVPECDLYLSPDHAVFVDDVLVPVKYLLNGTSIAQVRRDTITYYHIELPRHAVLYAEGLATESRLPTMDRSAYANGDGAVALYPDFHSRAWEAEGCAPLVVTGPLLADIRARLDRRVFDQPMLRRA